MAKPSAALPEWAVSGSYGATVYPSKVIATDPTAATSMAAWIAAVSAATAVAAPTDFGEIIHPSGGGATPWSSAANREATGITAFANAGFEPAIPIKAESFNEYENRIWQYVNWLRLASAAADLDDHVVQTDATGKTAVAQINLGGTAFAGSALTATSNASGAAATFTDTVGNFAATFAANGSLATARATNTGTGAALEALLVGSTGYALIADAGSAGAAGVYADGGSAGFGIEAYGSSGGQSAIYAEAIAGTQAAISAYGSAVANGPAIYAEAQSNGAHAISAATDATATAGAAALFAWGHGGGYGIHARADGGYALVVQGDQTSPSFAGLRMVACDTDPTTTATGDVWIIDEGGTDVWLRADLANDVYFWAGLYPRREDAFVNGGNSAHSGTDNEAVATGAFRTKKGGDVIVTVTAGVSKVTATGMVPYKIQSASDSGFTTAVVTHESESVDVTTVTNGSSAASVRIASQVKYAQGATYNNVDRYWRLVTTASSGSVYVWQAQIRVQGEFA